VKRTTLLSAVTITRAPLAGTARLPWAIWNTQLLGWFNFRSIVKGAALLSAAV
jgi:hypothetical protein